MDSEEGRDLLHAIAVPEICHGHRLVEGPLVPGRQVTLEFAQRSPTNRPPSGGAFRKGLVFRRPRLAPRDEISRSQHQVPDPVPPGRRLAQPSFDKPTIGHLGFSSPPPQTGPTPSPWTETRVLSGIPLWPDSCCTTTAWVSPPARREPDSARCSGKAPTDAAPSLCGLDGGHDPQIAQGLSLRPGQHYNWAP